ncbi:hypothetical protein ACMFMF_008083 [Clarireedia jacksonii]
MPVLRFVQDTLGTPTSSLTSLSSTTPITTLPPTLLLPSLTVTSITTLTTTTTFLPYPIPTPTHLSGLRHWPSHLAISPLKLMYVVAACVCFTIILSLCCCTDNVGRYIKARNQSGGATVQASPTWLSGLDGCTEENKRGRTRTRITETKMNGESSRTPVLTGGVQQQEEEESRGEQYELDSLPSLERIRAHSSSAPVCLDETTDLPPLERMHAHLPSILPIPVSDLPEPTRTPPLPTKASLSSPAFPSSPSSSFLPLTQLSTPPTLRGGGITSTWFTIPRKASQLFSASSTTSPTSSSSDCKAKSHDKPLHSHHNSVFHTAQSHFKPADNAAEWMDADEYTGARTSSTQFSFSASEGSDGDIAVGGLGMTLGGLGMPEFVMGVRRLRERVLRRISRGDLRVGAGGVGKGGDEDDDGGNDDADEDAVNELDGTEMTHFSGREGEQAACDPNLDFRTSKSHAPLSKEGLLSLSSVFSDMQPKGEAEGEMISAASVSRLQREGTVREKVDGGGVGKGAEHVRSQDVRHWQARSRGRWGESSAVGSVEIEVEVEVGVGGDEVMEREKRREKKRGRLALLMVRGGDESIVGMGMEVVKMDFKGDDGGKE